MRRTRIVFAAAAALLIAGGGAAAGAALIGGPVDRAGVIHGCWTTVTRNGSHTFALQDAGTPCPRGTTPISWNQVGRTGAAGPTGPVGPQGPEGPEGPAGGVPMDFGIIHGTFANGVLTDCSFADFEGPVGPDANTITTSAQPGNVCQVDGIADFGVALTPTDQTVRDSYTNVPVSSGSPDVPWAVVFPY